MVISILIQALLMKRVLYSSRESYFISENQDSMLNIHVDEVQQGAQPAVDSEYIFSSEKNKKTIPIEGAILLTEVEAPIDLSQTLINDNKTEMNHYAAKKKDKNPVISSATFMKKNKGESVTVKPKFVKGETSFQLEKSTTEVLVLNLKNQELGDELLQTEYVSEELNDLKPEEKILDKKEKMDLKKIESAVHNSQIKLTTPSVAEVKPAKEIELIENRVKNVLISSSNVLLENKGVPSILGSQTDSLEDITVNVDVSNGSYSQAVTSGTLYETINLTQSESIDSNEKKEVFGQKNRQEPIKPLIIRKSSRSSEEGNSHLSQQEARSTIEMFSKVEGEDGKFSEESFFKKDDHGAINKGIIEFVKETFDDADIGRSQIIESVEKKEVNIGEENVIPFKDETEAKGDQLLDSDTRLNNKDIVLFTGVNSDFFVQNIKDPLNDLLSFELNVLKSVSGKVQKTNEFLEANNTKTEVIAIGKGHSSNLFDNEVKKLISNSQPESETSSTPSLKDNVNKEIKFDDIIDTYQKFFSAYK